MSRARRVHTFTTADLAMSDALGVDARALCGVWCDVGDAREVGDGDRIGTNDDDGCLRCRASVRRIIRDKAHR